MCVLLGRFRTAGVKATQADCLFRAVGLASSVLESPRTFVEKMLRRLRGDVGSQPFFMASHAGRKEEGDRSFMHCTCAALAEDKEAPYIRLYNNEKIVQDVSMYGCKNGSAWRKQWRKADPKTAAGERIKFYLKRTE